MDAGDPLIAGLKTGDVVIRNGRYGFPSVFSSAWKATVFPSPRNAIRKLDTQSWFSAYPFMVRS